MYCCSPGLWDSSVGVFTGVTKQFGRGKLGLNIPARGGQQNAAFQTDATSLFNDTLKTIRTVNSTAFNLPDLIEYLCYYWNYKVTPLLRQRMTSVWAGEVCPKRWKSNFLRHWHVRKCAACMSRYGCVSSLIYNGALMRSLIIRKFYNGVTGKWVFERLCY